VNGHRIGHHDAADSTRRLDRAVCGKSLANGTGRRDPVRIAYVSETWPPEINGVALTAARTVAWLRARGHCIDLIRPRRPQESIDRRGIDEYRPPSLPLPFYREVRFGLASAARLRRRFLHSGAELVHVATPGPLGYAAARAAHTLGLPLTTDFRTNFHQYSRFYRAGILHPLILAYLRHFHNLGACTFVPTRALREQLSRDGFRRLHVVGRGVDEQLFSPERRCEQLRANWDAGGPGGFVILYVGRLAPEKGLELVLDAFVELHATDERLRMVVVGDGPQRRRLEGLYPAVHFAGWQRSEALARHYASADLFVQPSRSETFGNVTIEAMASALPVLAFATAAAAEHIRHLESGLLVDEANECEFVHALRHAVGAPERLAQIGQQARLAVRPLGWDSILGEFEAILERVASEATALRPAGDVVSR
jgi:glycosyltransferase involved in cell wall biosynthesis